VGTVNALVVLPIIQDIGYVMFELSAVFTELARRFVLVDLLTGLSGVVGDGLLVALAPLVGDLVPTLTTFGLTNVVKLIKA